MRSFIPALSKLLWPLMALSSGLLAQDVSTKWSADASRQLRKELEFLTEKSQQLDISVPQSRPLTWDYTVQKPRPAGPPSQPTTDSISLRQAAPHRQTEDPRKRQRLDKLVQEVEDMEQQGELELPFSPGDGPRLKRGR